MESKNVWPMDRFFRKMRWQALGMSYNDVLLITRYADILPADVNLCTRFSRNVPMNIPFVSSPMDTVTMHEMAIAMAKLGGLGIIHKNLTIKDQAAEVARVKFELNGFIKKPICVKDDWTMGQVMKMMIEKGYEERFHSLPVVNSEGKAVGLLTHSNFERCLNQNNGFRFDEARPVRSCMSKKLITAEKEASLVSVFKMMLENDIKVIPKLENDGTIAGMYVFKDVERIVTGGSPTFNTDDNGNLRVGAAVGTEEDTPDRVDALVAKGVDVLVIDTSHGYSKSVIDTLKKIKASHPSVDVVVGNIAEGDHAKGLVDAGADGLRVGIGPGSICTTRVITGVGKPQVSAIYDCAKAVRGSGVPICADGGIKYSGHVAIGLAAGADNVMFGNALAGTDESPGDIVTVAGRSYKIYRGMGSIGAMHAGPGAGERYFQGQEKEKEKLVPQGVEGGVPYRGKTSMVIHQFIGGLAGGMAHLGVLTLDEFHRHADFIRQTEAGARESHAHGLEFIEDAPNYSGKM